MSDLTLYKFDSNNYEIVIDDKEYYTYVKTNYWSISMVYVDFDGTLLNFNGALEDVFAEQGKVFNPKEVKVYDYTKGNFGVTKEEVYREINNPRMYYIMRPFDGAIEALKRLQSYAEVYAYTGSVSNVEITTIRNNLINSYGLYGTAYQATSEAHINDILPTELHGGTKPVFQYGVDAVFDDCLGVFYKWLSCGIRTRYYLIDAPYNKITENISTMCDWSQVIRCKNFSDAVDKHIKSIGK